MNPRASAAPRRREDDDGAFGVHLTRLKEMSDDELEAAIERLVTEETRISSSRREVHAVIDALTQGLLAGYRDGRASTDDLLKG